MKLMRGGKEPFRKAYQKLGDLRSFLPSSEPFVALTATAANTLGVFNTVTISSMICKLPAKMSLSASIG